MSRAQKRRRPVLAGTRRLPQETDSVAGSILVQAPHRGNGKSAAAPSSRHLVEPAQVGSLVSQALRRFRTQLEQPPTAAARAEQPELF